VTVGNPSYARFLGASERTKNGVRLVLPLPANRANARGSRWKEHRGKKAYWALLNALALDRRFPLPDGPPPEKVSVTVHLYVWSILDEGNAVARLKFVEDWLVASGYAVDDSPKHWEYTGLPEQSVDRGWQRLVVVLEAPVPERSD
jgi:hypothetical protein